jgi:3-hydroxyisobutyrate dehydrogenase-like beta-hydroxyacid dehydrogenase
MVGGAAEVVERARPMLAPMAGEVLHAGPVGQGAVLKLAVNGYFAAQLASLAELIGFLGHSGFARPQAADLLARFPVVAAPLAGAARMMAAGATQPLFTIDLIEKDLGYLIEAGARSGAALPSARAHRASFQAAQAAGHGASNVSGLAAVYA